MKKNLKNLFIEIDVKNHLSASDLEQDLGQDWKH